MSFFDTQEPQAMTLEDLEQSLKKAAIERANRKMYDRDQLLLIAGNTDTSQLPVGLDVEKFEHQAYIPVFFLKYNKEYLEYYSYADNDNDVPPQIQTTGKKWVPNKDAPEFKLPNTSGATDFWWDTTPQWMNSLSSVLQSSEQKEQAQNAVLQAENKGATQQPSTTGPEAAPTPAPAPAPTPASNQKPQMSSTSATSEAPSSMTMFSPGKEKVDVQTLLGRIQSSDLGMFKIEYKEEEKKDMKEEEEAQKVEAKEEQQKVEPTASLVTHMSFEDLINAVKESKDAVGSTVRGGRSVAEVERTMIPSDRQNSAQYLMSLLHTATAQAPPATSTQATAPAKSQPVSYPQQLQAQPQPQQPQQQQQQQQQQYQVSYEKEYVTGLDSGTKTFAQQPQVKQSGRVSEYVPSSYSIAVANAQMQPSRDVVGSRASEPQMGLTSEQLSMHNVQDLSLEALLSSGSKQIQRPFVQQSDMPNTEGSIHISPRAQPPATQVAPTPTPKPQFHVRPQSSPTPSHSNSATNTDILLKVFQGQSVPQLHHPQHQRQYQQQNQLIQQQQKMRAQQQQQQQQQQVHDYSPLYSPHDAFQNPIQQMLIQQKITQQVEQATAMASKPPKVVTGQRPPVGVGSRTPQISTRGGLTPQNSLLVPGGDAMYNSGVTRGINSTMNMEGSFVPGRGSRNPVQEFSVPARSVQGGGGNNGSMSDLLKINRSQTNGTGNSRLQSQSSLSQQGVYQQMQQGQYSSQQGSSYQQQQQQQFTGARIVQG